MIKVTKEVFLSPSEIAEALSHADASEQADFFASFFSYLQIACETEFRFDVQMHGITDACPPDTLKYLLQAGGAP